MIMENMKCLVLGGSGFIGSHLVNRLSSAKYDVVSIDIKTPLNKNPYVKYVNSTINHLINNNFYGENYNYIFHLFSSIIPNSRSSIGYDIDIDNTIKILDYAKDHKSKVIFASSGGTVYGNSKKHFLKEDFELNPINHYGVLKVTIELLLKMYNIRFEMQNIALRISNPYGEGQDYTKGVGLLDALIKKNLHDEELTIYGDGKNIRDYIYIDDVAEGFLCAMLYEGSEYVFNLGTGVGTSINEAINIVSNVTKKPFKKINYVENRDIDVQSSVLDISKIKSLMNFDVKNSIEQGITMYYDYLFRNM